MKKHVLWVEAYRPNTIEDCILPESIKEPFRNFVKSGEVPNLLLCGKPGTGKTTIAKALIEDLDADCLFINASKDGNIDMLRTTVQDFASRVSFEGKRKFVIMDEADSLSHKTQESLRSFIEEYSRYCGFIFTCNYKNKIMEPLRKRLIQVDFKFPKEKSDEWKLLIRKALSVCKNVLTEHNVKFVDKAVLLHITKNYPDMRTIINELQHYSKRSSIIDEGLITSVHKNGIEQMIKYLIEKDFTKTMAWVDENTDVDFMTIVEELDDHFSKQDMKKENYPIFILHLNEHDAKNSIVSSQTLNLKAMLTNVMKDCF